MIPVIIVHHHEIILKGDNRGFFERQLIKNIRAALSDLSEIPPIMGGYGKFIIPVADESLLEPVVSRLKYLFGIANICAGLQLDQDIRLFCEAAEQILRNRSFRTIRVETRRPDKNFPTRSMEVNKIVGAHLCDTFGVRANMSAPDETIFIEITDGTAYVYCSKVQGAKGLPAGVSGKVISLLSAGIDSPVAAWQLMKRGASVVFVHFHSMPYTSQQAVDQVRELSAILTRYQFRSKLYLVPFAELQQEIVRVSPQAFRVILYRRFMVRIAEAIAREENAEALVTGEAVGQVASQTLRNIRAIDEVATLPVLRPLSGSDKEETITVARRIGTFEISQQPYDDCCSFLAPRKPETWANLSEVRAAESDLNVETMIAEALRTASIEYFFHPPAMKEHAADQPVD